MLSQAAFHAGPRPSVKSSSMWDKLTRPKFKHGTKKVEKEVEQSKGFDPHDKEKVPETFREQLRTLRAELEDVRLKGEILGDCLRAAGVLTDASMNAAIRRYHGSVAMDMFSQMPELVTEVGRGAGLEAARCFGLTSRAHAHGIAATKRDLERQLPPKVCVVGGTDASNRRLGTVEYFDVAAGGDSEGSWKEVAAMQSRRSRCAAVAMTGSLFVFGGLDASGRRLDTVERLDLDKESWVSLQAMPTGRGWCAATVLQKKVYVVGGYAGGNPLSVVECYDPATDSWTSLPPLANHKGWCTSAVVGGAIYVIGGYAGNAPLGDVEFFDPAVRKWAPLPPVPTPRAWCTAAALQGHIYVIGGSGASGRPVGTVERFDPIKKSWISLSPMPTPRAWCAAVVSSGRLFVVGGINPAGQPLNTVEVFDPLSGWQKLPPMCTRREGCAAAAVST